MRAANLSDDFFLGPKRPIFQRLMQNLAGVFEMKKKKSVLVDGHYSSNQQAHGRIGLPGCRRGI